MRNRRTWGYIADISQNTSAITSTPYLFAAICRMVYLREGETEFIFARARVATYAANCLTSVDTQVRKGNPIFGIPPPTLGSYTGATFSTWEKGALAGWRNEGLRPAIFTSDGDLGPWSRAPRLRSAPRVSPRRKPAPELRAYGSNLRHLWCASILRRCPKTFANPLTFGLPPYLARNLIVGFTSNDPSKHSADNIRSSASRPKNATTYAKIRDAHTIEDKLHAQEERRLRRETSGRQADLEEANRQKYLLVFRETRHGGRSAERSVSPPPHLRRRRLRPA